jgi:3-methyladenine DNA glycosylase Tag
MGTLFMMMPLCLNSLFETFQAGLSWITILNKRENFRKAFNNFDYKKIALYSEEEKFKPFKTQESFGTN